METTAAGNRGDFEEFLGILEASFKGRKCYLGQYGSTWTANEGDSKHTKGRVAVGSVVVTLEAGGKLVIGAFVSTAVDGEWEYWEGEFGATELEEHRNNLGWDGHSLKTLGECFVGALDDTPQPSQSQSGADTADATTEEDEHQQRPPEFSSIGDEGSDEDEDEKVGSGGQDPSTSAIGTLDLHYAGAGIVGSWDIRMQRSIRAACWRKPTGAVEAPGAASGSSSNASSSRLKSSGTLKTKRQRFAGKGATLMGAQSSAEA
eukprot:g12513.t2